MDLPDALKRWEKIRSILDAAWLTENCEEFLDSLPPEWVRENWEHLITSIHQW